jgi:hypothetical protein
VVWLSKREKGLRVQTNDAVHYSTVNTIPKDIPSVALLPGLGESIRLLYVFWFQVDQNPLV